MQQIIQLVTTSTKVIRARSNKEEDLLPLMIRMLEDKGVVGQTFTSFSDFTPMGTNCVPCSSETFMDPLMGRWYNCVREPSIAEFVILLHDSHFRLLTVQKGEINREECYSWLFIK